MWEDEIVSQLVVKRDVCSPYYRAAGGRASGSPQQVAPAGRPSGLRQVAWLGGQHGSTRPAAISQSAPERHAAEALGVTCRCYGRGRLVGHSSALMAKGVAARLPRRDPLPRAW